jgi:hypothetical protein
MTISSFMPAGIASVLSRLFFKMKNLAKTDFFGEILMRVVIIHRCRSRPWRVAFYSASG